MPQLKVITQRCPSDADPTTNHTSKPEGLIIKIAAHLSSG